MRSLKKTVAILSLLGLLGFTAGCERGQDNDFRDRFRWIAGKWKGELDGRTIIERWSWKKHRYEGSGIEIEGGDTVFSEKLFLESHDGHASYIALLEKQPPVLFSATFIKPENTWQFENKEHDFPSRILYRLEDDSTLRISVLGSGGSGDGFSYTLKRNK